ncbi:hypothetical protein GCM10010433_24380 [Streptomyces pulveraceus]
MKVPLALGLTTVHPARAVAEADVAAKPSAAAVTVVANNARLREFLTEHTSGKWSWTYPITSHHTLGMGAARGRLTSWNAEVDGLDCVIELRADRTLRASSPGRQYPAQKIPGPPGKSIPP